MSPPNILRALLDVATGKTAHLGLGSCPEPETGHPEWRDPECPACQVLVSAETAVDAMFEAGRQAERDECANLVWSLRNSIREVSQKACAMKDALDQAEAAIRTRSTTSVSKNVNEQQNAGLSLVERECCGTFFRSPHRITCSQYRGKKGASS